MPVTHFHPLQETHPNQTSIITIIKNFIRLNASMKLTNSTISSITQEETLEFPSHSITSSKIGAPVEIKTITLPTSNYDLECVYESTSTTLTKKAPNLKHKTQRLSMNENLSISVISLL